MKRKIYTFLMVGVTLISCFANTSANAQNQQYWRETFDPTGPNGDPTTGTPPVLTPATVDYVGSAGTWRFYGLWITTGQSCTTGTLGGENRHVRSTNAAVTDTPYIISPLVNFGINELRFVRSRMNRRITIYKTTDTAIATTNWVLAAVIPKNSAFPNPVCADSAVIINDAAAKRVMIKFERAVNSDVDSVGLTSVLALPLPIKFSSINAQAASGFVKVSWNIQSEINTLKYDIEKSIDGRIFTTIGAIAASNAGKYSWIDNSISTNNSYYRIKGIDKDGALTYSTIVRINSSKKLAELNVTPNPVQGSLLNLQLNNAEKGTYTLRLYNNAGALVFSKAINAESGAFSNTVELPASVVKGVYQLQLINGASKLSKAVVVQ